MRTKLGHGHGASLVREAYPGHILFENRDGLYYLRGNDLASARTVLGLECDGATGVGFDTITLSLYLKQLLAKGLQVGILRGKTVQAIKLQNTKASHKVPSTTIGLAPRLLLGQKEIDRLQHCFTSRQSSLRDRVESLWKELSNGHGMSPRDLGTIYVYQVDVDFYEVDWELTTMAPSAFEILALATHRAGQMLPCRLALPRSKRRTSGNKPRILMSVSEPLTYGQLRLPI